MRYVTNYDEAEKLYKQGFSFKEISLRLGIKYGTLYSYFRRKDGFKKNRISLDLNLLKELAAKDLSCAEIARQTGYKEISVYHALKRNNIPFHNGKLNYDKELSTVQKNLIIGSLYGDFSLDSSKVSSRLGGIHSIKQKEYLLWKLSYLNNIKVTTYEHNPKPDKRTGKIYKGFGFVTEYNSCFNEFKEMYDNGAKELNYKLLIKYYNDLSLAVHFMDDGSKTKCSYVLATNCFTTENLERFQLFLKERFNLITSIYKSSNTIHIKAISRKTFEEIIKPYIHKDMQYKLLN